MWKLVIVGAELDDVGFVTIDAVARYARHAAWARGGRRCRDGCIEARVVRRARERGGCGRHGSGRGMRSLSLSAAEQASGQDEGAAQVAHPREVQGSDSKRQAIALPHKD